MLENRRYSSKFVLYSYCIRNALRAKHRRPLAGIFCVLFFFYRKDRSVGLLPLHILFYFWVVMRWLIVDDVSFVCLYSMLLRYIAHLRNLLCESLMGRVLSMGFWLKIQVFVFDFSFDISRRFRSSWGELHTLRANDSSWGSWGELLTRSRSSDLSSRAAPRCLFCVSVSDLRFKCLFSTFLSTSFDDFEALGANFTLLERSWSLLGRVWGGPA